MFGFRFNIPKCETTTKLCLGRIKLLRNKRNIQVKQLRKEIAELLKAGKQENARIRVEGVIRENLMFQAFEILELYLELLSQRVQLIAKTKEIPRDMIEAVSSIIYAAQRISDLPELTTLKQLFATKYGKEYAAEASSDATACKWQVNQNLIRCLLVEPPAPEEKLQMLSEIAQEHGVEWDMSSAARQLLPSGLGSGGSSYSLPVTPPAIPATAPLPSNPLTMQGGYQDAQQAAAAAAAAAAQAKAAADYAAQYAQVHGGMPATPPTVAGPPVAPTPPSAGWLLQQTPGLSSNSLPPAPVPQGQPPSVAPATGLRSVASEPALPGATTTMDGQYVVKSIEEIQKAYDEALGPPTKPHASGDDSNHGPSAPPPAPPAFGFPPSPPPVPTGFDLPAPPAGFSTQAPSNVEDEYDELTRRLEALKRS